MKSAHRQNILDIYLFDIFATVQVYIKQKLQTCYEWVNFHFVDFHDHLLRNVNNAKTIHLHINQTVRFSS